MNCRRYRQAGTVALVAAALAASVSCTAKVREGKSSSYLVIDSLKAVAGPETEFEDTLSSDVQTKGGVYEDTGKVKLHVALKDIGTTDSPTEVTANNLITIERYRVSYVRSDGRNVQGTDVPYAFDGAITGTIGAEASELSFVIVRAQAKLEAPLLALRGLAGAVAISTIANVTFYGHDQVGNDVSVTGSISVNFTDWADPE